MTEAEAILTSIIAVTSLLFVWGKVEIDLVALLTLSLLLITGLLDPSRAFSGFASETVVTIACVFAVGGAIRRSGAADKVAALLYRVVGESVMLAVVIITTIAMALSSVMNNIAVVAILLPAVVAFAERARISPTPLLLPVSFGALLGGMLTPLGTPPNLVANQLLQQRGIALLTFKDFFFIGGSTALAGALVVCVLMPILFRRKKRVEGNDTSISATEAHGIAESLVHLEVPYSSPLSGKSLLELHFAEIVGAPIISINRGGRIIPTPARSERLFSGDAISLITSPLVEERLSLFHEVSFVERPELVVLSLSSGDKIAIDEKFVVAVGDEASSVLIHRENVTKACAGVSYLEHEGDAIFEIRGSLLGRRERLLRAFDGLLNFMRADGQGVLYAVGNHEVLKLLTAYNELHKQSPSSAFQLESSETAVIETLLSPRSRLLGKKISELQFRERFDFSILSVWRKGRVIRDKLGELRLEFGDALLLVGPRKKLPVLSANSDFVPLLTENHPSRKELIFSLSGLCLLILLSTVFGLPTHIAAFSAVMFLVLTSTVTLSDVYREIDWRVVVMVGALLPLGDVFQSTGFLSDLNGVMVQAVRDVPLSLTVLGLIGMSSLLSQVLEASVAVLFAVPLAITVAALAGVPPQPLVMAVTLGSSIAFLLPVSHRAHVLVVSPGGYKPSHFLSIGIPVTAVTVLIVWWLTMKSI